MTTLTYEFVIAYQSEDEVTALKETTDVAPPSVKIVLPNGLPNFKTIYSSAESEAAAFHKVDEYVKTTLYKDITDNITL